MNLHGQYSKDDDFDDEKHTKSLCLFTPALRFKLVEAHVLDFSRLSAYKAILKVWGKTFAS